MTLTLGLSVAVVLQAGLAVFGAAVLRGFTGFGFAIAAVPLLTLILPPTEAVIIVLLLQCVAGLFDFPTASKACDWPSLRRLAVGALIGSPVGLMVLSGMPIAAGRFAIAALTLASVLLLTTRPTPKANAGPGSSVLFGFAAGLFNGLAAMPGPPVIIFYMGTAVPNAVARASMLVFFFFTSTVGLATSLFAGAIGWDAAVLAALTLPALWCGSRIGTRWFAVGSEAHYRRIALGSLSVLAFISGFAAIMDMLAG